MENQDLSQNSPQSAVEAQGGVYLGEVTQVPEDQNNSPVSLSDPSEGISTMPSTELAQRRSNKVDYSLGKTLKKSASEIFTDMANGRELNLRNQAASELSAKAAQVKSDILSKVVAENKGPISLDDFKKIYSTDVELNPNTILEKEYANKYLNSVQDAAIATGSKVLQEAQEQSPQALEATKAKANDLLTKMEIVRNVQENVEDTLKQQGWVPWLVDQAKSLTQIYPELKMRGLNPEVGKISGGLMLGTNLEAQADQLFNLPTDQFETALNTIVNNLKKDNPSLAKQFIDYVAGVSNTQRVLDNTFTLLFPADTVAAGKLGLGLLRKASVEARAAKAFKDSIQSAQAAGKDMPISAAASEGAGDINAAAALRANASLKAEASGTADPVTSIKEKLPSNFNLDAETLQQGYDYTRPGALSREKMTRLVDSVVQSGQNLRDSLANVLRPNRTPLPLDDPEAMKAYNDWLRGSFKGIDNQILDFSPPRHEPTTNTNWVDVHFGSNDGALFSSPEVAKANAELNGFKNVGIVEAKGAVEVEPSQLGGPVRARMRKAQLEGDTGAIARNEKFIRDNKKRLREDKTLTPEQKKKIGEDLKIAKEVLERNKKELEDVNKKVFMTDAKIEQNGVGYKYVITKPYKETEDVVRNYMIRRGDGSYAPEALSTSSMTGTQSWKNAALGWFRGADDSLSVNEAIQRKAVTYARNAISKWAKEEAKKIEAVANGHYRVDPETGETIPWYRAKARSFVGKMKNKEVFDQFNQVLNYARKAKDPETGETGYFFKTPTELEDHYMRYYNRMPSFPEVEAYFAHVKLTEGDRVFREIQEFRNRAREGAEQHQVFFTDKNSRIGSGFFDGVQKNAWPSGNGQVLVMGKKKGDERLAYVSNQKGGFNSKELLNIKEGIEQGRYKVIEIYNPADYPLRGFSDIAGDNYIRYVVTDNAETKPLDFNHVNRRGGGHFEYDYNFYIKQAKIIKQTVSQSENDLRKLVASLYVGDTTMMPIGSRALGKDVADKINAVRVLINDGKWDEAETLARKTLPMEWEEFSSWFKPSRGKDGKVVGPRLDPSEPFLVVPKNKKVYDLDKGLEQRHGASFQDGTKSGSLAARNQVAYNVQRDNENLSTVNRVSNGNGSPLFNYEPAEMVDPIPTMNRALNRAINSVFMDDYKIYAVEHWLREATPHLLASESELKASPFFHFENTIDKSSFKSGTDWSTIQNLLLNRMKIKQFVGMPNTFDTAVHSLTQHLLDSSYEKGTEKFTALPIWMLSKAKDPVQIIRSIAFNAKLGLFNPAQMLVQAQTFTNIWAIEPRRGALGTYATTLHQMARMNSSPAMLNKLDEMASKFNMFGVKWRPGEFKEARELLNRTGFEHVAGEHQYADTQLQSAFVKNEWKNFLNAGQIFFREGEKSTRLGAWYTSYKKFRDANPVGKITDKDLGEILNYADLLTNNMSRASASNLHSGVFSLTSQFLSYQLHLFELMFGKRLGATTAERNWARARMFTMYGSLYGIPAASGLVGYPFGDSIREEAISRGYVVGENWLSSLAMEGIPSYLTFLATGNAYNFGSRYGSQGLTFVQEALKSDNTFWKIAGGAGLSTVGGILNGFGPLTRDISYYISGDNKKLSELGASHPFKTSDIVDAFKEVSTVNQAVKVYYAMMTGRWLSKNGQYLDDVSSLNAIFMGILGVNPQRVDDTYAKINIEKAEKEAQELAYKKFESEIRRSLMDSRNGDQSGATDRMRRAFWNLEMAGYPTDKKALAISRAMKGYESMANSVDANFALRNVPQFKKGIFGTNMNLPFLGQSNVPETRLKQFETQKQMENK